MLYNAIDDLEETGKIVAFLGKDRKAPYIKREPLYPCRANDHGEPLRTSTQPSPVHKPRPFLTAPPRKTHTRLPRNHLFNTSKILIIDL